MHTASKMEDLQYGYIIEYSAKQKPKIQRAIHQTDTTT